MPEYNWIAMDGDGHTYDFSQAAPMWCESGSFENKWNGYHGEHIKEPPGFLKPGQLWEFIEDIGEMTTRQIIEDCFLWDNRWWRKIEEHNNLTT